MMQQLAFAIEAHGPLQRGSMDLYALFEFFIRTPIAPFTRVQKFNLTLSEGFWMAAIVLLRGRL
jgi:hypothetical protein